MFVIAYPVFLFAAFGIGLRLLTLFKYEPQSRLVKAFIAITLGYAFIGQFVFLLGLLKLLYPWLIWIIFIVISLLNFGLVVLFFRETQWKSVPERLRDGPFLENALLFMSVLALILHAAFCIAPQIHWDAMSHHYLVPVYFLKHHAVIDFPDVLFSYYPSLIEMQYLAGMALGGEVCANLIGNSHGFILYFGIIALAQLMFQNWRIGIWAGVVFLSVEGIHMHFQGGWNDLGTSLFVMASIMLLFEYGKTSHRGVFFLSAIFMGAAMASKHYAWLPFIFVFLFLIYDFIHRKQLFTRGLSSLVLYAIVALSMPLIWYLRSFILTGNPVYPFSVLGLFPTYHLPPFEITSWAHTGFKRNIVTFLLYPLYLMFGSSWIPQLTGRLPYLLCIAPISLMMPYDKNVRAIWGFIIWTFILMYIVAPFETRYMMYVIPFAAALCGYAVVIHADKLKIGKVLILPMLFVIFLIPFSVNIQTFEHDWNDKLDVIIKKEWRDSYLLRQSNTYGAIWWMNNNLPEDSEILCLEKFLYRLDRNFVTWPGMKEKYPENTNEAMEKNYRRGNTHMFLGEGGMAQAYILWHIFQLDEDENGFIKMRIEDVLLNLNDEPVPDKFWILRLSIRRDLERWGFKKEIINSVTWYSAKKDVLDDAVTNAAALTLVDIFKEMLDKKWVLVQYVDGLNMVVKFDYDKWIADK